MSFTINAKIITRNGTAAEWTAENPTLLLGEVGVESDTNKVKVGDGSTAWNSLAYFTANGYAQVITVALAGGDFDTVQAAVDSITDSSASKPYLIAVYPGVYVGENIFDKDYVSVVGVDRKACRLEFTRVDAQGSTEDGHFAAWIECSHFRMANLTIHNPADNFPGIGCALVVNSADADSNVRTDIYVENCDITCVGGRDTIFSFRNAKPTFRNCYIEGDSDIVSNQGIVLENCEIHANLGSTDYAGTWNSCDDAVAGTAEFYNCVFSGRQTMFNMFGGDVIAVGCTATDPASALWCTFATVGTAATLYHSNCTVPQLGAVGANAAYVTLSPLAVRDYIAIGADASPTTGKSVLVGAKSDGSEDQTAFMLDIKTNESVGSFDYLGIMVNGAVSKFLRFSVGASKWFASHLISAPQFDSTIATGTAPLTVASTTKVTNLNADLLDGLHDTAFVKHSIATAKGDILAATGSGAIARVAAGADGQVLTADAASTAGVKWAAAGGSGIPATIVDAKGDIIAATAADTVARVAVGTNGHALLANSGATPGVEWGAVCRFRGAASAEPTGNIIGDMWYDTGGPAWKIYNGSGWDQFSMV